MLYAPALDAKGLLKDMAVTVLLNSDEEMGSLSSRNIWRSRQPCMTMDWSMNPRNQQSGKSCKGLGQEICRKRQGFTRRWCP